jgi:hypothetical protein
MRSRNTFRGEVCGQILMAFVHRGGTSLERGAFGESVSKLMLCVLVGIVEHRSAKSEYINNEKLYCNVIYLRTNCMILSHIGGLRDMKLVSDLLIEFIGPLYNLLQHFTNHYLRLDTLDF